MGCTTSKEPTSPDIEQSKSIKSQQGPPTKHYSYVQVGGKPKELGSGAYSVVLEAKNLKSQEIVAIKKIDKKNLQPHDHDALQNEVSLLNECKGQSNILSILGFYEERNFYYLVTEEVAGGELFDRICDKESYTEHEARILVNILLKTLNFLHNKQIAHRDLKPENLLLKSKTDDTTIILAVRSRISESGLILCIFLILTFF